MHSFSSRYMPLHCRKLSDLLTELPNRLAYFLIQKNIHNEHEQVEQGLCETLTVKSLIKTHTYK